MQTYASHMECVWCEIVRNNLIEAVLVAIYMKHADIQHKNHFK